MDKYEYKQLSERMIELMQNEEYGEAKEIADSIDWRRVRNAMMLANVSDIYEKTGEYQKSYDILQIAYHRAEGSEEVRCNRPQKQIQKKPSLGGNERRNHTKEYFDDGSYGLR